MPDFLFTPFSSQNSSSNANLITTSGRSTKGTAPADYVSDSLATASLFAQPPGLRR